MSIVIIICIVMGRLLGLFLLFCIAGCTFYDLKSDSFTYQVISTKYFDIATWQKITDVDSPIHIYIEGDGNSFDAMGRPTSDPTPNNDFLQNLAVHDSWANVVYMARPCQFIMSKGCNVSDWTDGRFSYKIIESMSEAIRKIAKNKQIILIGYSGGAMVSGLVIKNNSDLNVVKWITVAGVLNHKMWTEYFGDSPLSQSLDLDELPNVPQLHYVAEYDEIVPLSLINEMTKGKNVIVVPGATHDSLNGLTIDFSLDDKIN